MQVTDQLILECLNELNKQSLSKQPYKDYYEGNHKILKDYAMQDSRSNRKLIFNYPRKFVDNETGYLLTNMVFKLDETSVYRVSFYIGGK